MHAIETDRIMIRKFTPEDWKDLYDYLSDATVLKFEPYDIFTEAQCKLEAIKRSNQESFLAVCLKSTGKLIGNIYIEQQHPKKYSTWELGYVFNSKYQGYGYATESCKVVLNYAFRTLQARRVIAMCNPQNKASWKLLERLHFRKEGHLLKNIYFKSDEQGDPIWQDTYEYAILFEEWLSQTAKA